MSPAASSPNSRRTTRPAYKKLGLEALEERLALSAERVLPLPLAGDWDGNGSTNLGVYDTTTGKAYTRSGANTSGFADGIFSLGPSGSAYKPIAGDWNNDNRDTLGLYNSATGQFKLRNNNASTQVITFSFTPPGTAKTPLAGDWDGKNGDSVGIYDAGTGTFYLRNSNSTGPAQIVVAFGPKVQGWTPNNPNFKPVVGNFFGTGSDDIGLFDKSTGLLYVDADLSRAKVDAKYLVFSPLNDNSKGTPVAGDFNKDGKETLGLFREDQTFDLRDQLKISTTTSVYIPPASSTLTTGAAVGAPQAAAAQLSAADVNALLRRAAAASASTDAIIVVVDRQGRILGARVESGVAAAVQNNVQLRTFAIDGAAAKARSAASFANAAGPLTSRTLWNISQSTITQREVQSNPNIVDPNSTQRGPGFVAAIGIGGHFPPEVKDTPPVDLFGIEHQNRDSLRQPGPDGIKGNADDYILPNRFNVPNAFIPAGQNFATPESYGFVSGLFVNAQTRGFGTLPGGVALYKGGHVVGAIGVFFPGPKGYADFEQGFIPGIGQKTTKRMEAPKALEAEWIAFAAGGGYNPNADTTGTGRARAVGALGGVAPVTDGLPFGRINLGGIELSIVGPGGVFGGQDAIFKKGAQVGIGSPNNSRLGNNINEPILGSNAVTRTRPGLAAPEGWLVLPHDGVGADSPTAADVIKMVTQGVAGAENTRAQTRITTVGDNARMVVVVTDKLGNVLGEFRMPDALTDAVGVTVARARSVGYYAQEAPGFNAIDEVEELIGPKKEGLAFSNRTFRFLAQPFIPEGIDKFPPAPWSSLLAKKPDGSPAFNKKTGENNGAPLSYAELVVAAENTKLNYLYDAFLIGSVFHQASSPNQNGVIFFPGAVPIYRNGELIGGLGVSGDGVDQDDLNTADASVGYGVPDAVVRADEIFIQGEQSIFRLPYLKFPRNGRLF